MEENSNKLYPTLGSSYLLPAKSCAIIKKIFPSKKTGYYWVQNFCSKKMPLRVLCDFETSSLGSDYYFLGEYLPEKNINGLIKNENDISIT